MNDAILFEVTPTTKVKISILGAKELTKNEIALMQEPSNLERLEVLFKHLNKTGAYCRTNFEDCSNCAVSRIATEIEEKGLNPQDILTLYYHEQDAEVIDGEGNWKKENPLAIRHNIPATWPEAAILKVFASAGFEANYEGRNTVIFIWR